MADKDVVIFNGSLVSLETPHIGDTVVISQPTRFDGPVTLGGVARSNWGSSIVSGIASAGSATTLTLPTSVTVSAGAFVGMLLRIDSGAGVGRSDIIISHTVGIGPTVTVAAGTVMNNTSNFSIFATGSNSALQTPFTPVGNIAATDVQNALAELDTEKLAATSATASAIANVPSGTIASTNVQAALNELDLEKATTGSVALKANNASPTLTGVPRAPTAAVGTNTTQLATTAFVQAATPVFRGAYVFNTLGVTKISGVVKTIPFNSELYDTDAIHNTAAVNTRLTTPAGVTKIRLTAAIYVLGASAANYIGIININGTATPYTNVHYVDGITTAVVVVAIDTPVINTVAGDYYQLLLTAPGSGTILAVNTYFAMEIIE